MLSVRTDSVFVDVFHGTFGVESVPGLLRNGHEAAFDFEVAGKSGDGTDERRQGKTLMCIRLLESDLGVRSCREEKI